MVRLSTTSFRDLKPASNCRLLDKMKALSRASAWCTEYLTAVDNPLRIPVQWNESSALLRCILTLLGSKPILRLTEREKVLVATLTLQAFLSSLGEEGSSVRPILEPPRLLESSSSLIFLFLAMKLLPHVRFLEIQGIPTSLSEVSGRETIVRPLLGGF